MELKMVVGVLVDVDDEYAEIVRADCTVIGELLQREGAGTWAEPALTQDAEFEMWGYSGLHTVRRLAMHLAASGRIGHRLLLKAEIIRNIPRYLPRSRDPHVEARQALCAGRT
jgi:hypothetical protein